MSEALYMVEKHFIGPTHAAWGECDTLCFHAKNLYNQGLYRVRQHFFATNKYLNYSTLQKQLQSEGAECYRSMKSKVAQLVLQQVDHDFKAFFAANRAWKAHPEKFLGKPKIPHYKEKKGRSAAHFNVQACNKKRYGKQVLQLSGLLMQLPLQHQIVGLRKERVDKATGEVNPYKSLSLKEVTVTPRNDGYLVVVKHEVPAVAQAAENGLCAGIDMGVNNLMAVVSTVKGQRPLLVSGKPLKSVNRYYNKKLAEYRSALDTCTTRSGKKKLNQKLQKLTRVRGHKVDDYLHKASRIVVNRLALTGVTHLIVGKNDGWKQEADMSKVANQNFVQIPHAKLVGMLRYKWGYTGGLFSETEESYTSKCSFLDNEEMAHAAKHAGKRVHRGLFKTFDGYLLNADVNGAANMIRKVVREAWDPWSPEERIEGLVVGPVDVAVPQYLGGLLQTHKMLALVA